jgi:hypothetical protein
MGDETFILLLDICAADSVSVGVSAGGNALLAAAGNASLGFGIAGDGPSSGLGPSVAVFEASLAFIVSPDRWTGEAVS